MSIVNKYILDIQTKGAKASKQAIGGVTNSLGSMAKKMGVVAGAYFGSQALISGIRASVQAYGEQEKVEKKLAQALGSSTTALKNQASALQKITTFGDEATLSQMSYLASIGLTEEQISEMIPVAMDLASATGMSLESAVRNTAKTLSGMTGELGESVPALRELTAEQLKAGEGVKVLGRLFGGMAKTEAETFEGSLTQMTNAVGDTAEAFGSLLVPIVIPLADGLKFLAEGTTSVIEKFKWLHSEQAEVVEVFEENDIALNEYKDTISGLSAGELVSLVSAQNTAMESTSFFGDETQLLIDKQLLLKKTLEGNAEYMEAMTGDIETQNIRRKESDDNWIVGYLKGIRKVKESNIDLEAGEKEYIAWKKEQKEKQVAEDLKNAVLSGQSASESMKAVVRAETMEAVSGYISSVLKGVPFPLNIGLASAGGVAVAGLMNSALSMIPNFAEGGSMMVSRPTLFLAGEDGAERVNVTNLEKPDGGADAVGGGITLNISAPLVDESVVDHIIPAIEKANRMNLA